MDRRTDDPPVRTTFMIAQIGRWGSSLAPRIPSAFARLLAVSEGRSVELRVENGSLLVTPVQERPTCRLDDLLAGMDPDPARADTEDGARSVGRE